MNVNISPDATSLFPQLGTASLVVQGLGTASGLDRERDQAIASAAASMAAIVDYDDVASSTEVQAWRETMRAMGLRPGEYRSSLEALMRMWTAGRHPDSGIAAIDLYNCVSISTRAPLGAVDLARITPGCDLTLRIARPGEDRFQPVAGSVTMKPGATAVSYCLEDQIVCYALNHRDSALFGIGDKTDEAMFFAEWTNAEQFSLALAGLSQLAATFSEAGAEAGEPICSGWQGD